MFDFEKLEVYQIVKDQNINVLRFLLTSKSIDPYFLDQWKRASMSILMNLAEGTGRMTHADKKHYYTIARGSVFECVSILDILKGLEYIPKEQYDEFYQKYEQISKMLLGMYRSYSS
jgi:four helix bundle protein